LGLIFLGETPTNLVILGGLIILSGVAIAIISSK
jgi:drug/metabolite transporter (DMT)-like permease